MNTKIELYESDLLHTRVVAEVLAKRFSSKEFWKNAENNQRAYYTIVKEDYAKNSDYCWRVTNRFDPRVEK